MASVFFFLFVIFIIGLLLIIFLIKGVSSFIFGKPFSFSDNSASDDKKTSWYKRKNKADNDETNKKVFPKDEGEYVNYEEIKEKKD